MRKNTNTNTAATLTAPVIAKAAITSTADLDVTIAHLIAQREIWQKGSYTTSNTELYIVLGGCLDMFNAIKGNAALAKGLNEVLRNLNVNFNEHTSLELRIARLVFATHGAEAKTANRVNAYARVIKVAADNKQTSATLAQFIVANHGIEEIRRSGTQSGKLSVAKLNERNREIADNVLAAPTANALFANFALPDDLKPEAGRRYSLALVRQNPDGTGSIVFGTNSVAAVNSVLAIAGKDITADAHKKAEEALQIGQAAQRDSNIQAFNETASDIASIRQIAA